MSDPSHYADRAPASVVQDPAFWFGNPCLIVVTVASLVTMVALVAIVGRDGSLGSAVPALAIYSLVFWGLWVGTRAFARMEIEHGIAMTVNARAADWLRKVLSGESPRPDLERVEPELLPNNPSSDVAIVRLFQHIVKEARDRRSSPGVLIMQPYREESYSDLFQLQAVQRTALQLGILGTFIGLVLALVRLRPGTEGGFEIGEVGSLIASLDVAFTTSIAGIAVAVLLGLMLMGLRGKQESYFRAMEEATLSVTSLARNAINKDEYLAQLGEVQVAINQLGDRILAQSNQTGAQTEVLQRGVRRLVETKSQLDGFLNRLGEEQSAFVAEMKEVYDRLSPERLAERLDQHVERSMARMLDGWDRGIEASLGDLSGWGETLQELRGVLEGVADAVRDEQEGFRKVIEESSEGLERLSSSLDQVAQRQIDWLEELDQATPGDLEERIGTAVCQAFEAALGGVEPIAVRPPETPAPAAGSEDLAAAIRSVGEVHHTTLRRIASEMVALRKTMERRREPSPWRRRLRRAVEWWRREWTHTTAGFRSLVHRVGTRWRRRWRRATGKLEDLRGGGT